MIHFDHPNLALIKKLKSSVVTAQIKSLEAWLHYSTHWKNGPRSTLYPSGGDKPTPAASKIDTDVPAALPYTRPVAERLFKDLEDGQGLVFTAGFVSEMKDGALVMVNATLGLAGDHADTKQVFFLSLF